MAVTVPQLTRKEARELTDEAKNDAATLWAKLYALHEGGAHRALGYVDWGAYTVAEFGWSPTVGKQRLHAGRVRAALERKVAIATLPENEAVTRELAPVLHKAPDQLEEVWAEAVATTEHETPTAVEVRAVVDRRAPQVRPRPRRVKRLGKHERHLLDVQAFTDQLREIDKLTRNAVTQARRGRLIGPANDGRWYEILRRITENAELAREVLAQRAQDERWPDGS